MRVEEEENLYDIEGLQEKTLLSGLSDSSREASVFVADLQTGKTVWSANAVQYFGLPDDYGSHFDEIWFARIHPDDLDKYRRDISGIMTGTKTAHTCQYRVANAAGAYVWVECNGSVRMDKESRKKFFIGYLFNLDKTGMYDSITGCLTLKEFYNKTYSKQHIFVLVGIDAFRKVINRIGFSESNTVLRMLGDILQRTCTDHLVYRMTGDEFLIILPNYSQEELQYMHEKILDEFTYAVEQYHSGLRVKFSAAATYYNPDNDTKESVMRRLEHTLDYAKQRGSGSFCIYSRTIEEEHERASLIQEALTKAIEHDFHGFQLVYQPVIRMDGHVLDGAEALLRFYHEELGIISPAEFIPMLEASGEIRQVGLWVASQVIAQKVKWEKIRPDLALGFNTSLIQYRDDTFSRRVAELVEKAQIDPTRLIVELTESQKMSDPAHLRRMLQPLVDRKINIFLDDFGMEASTFTMVQELPVQGVKVDHSFVRTMVGSGSDRKDRANIAIVSSINHMANLLGLNVVVEGVENQKIDELLSGMNIGFTQGYYYSRPVSVEEFEQNWLCVQNGGLYAGGKEIIYD